VAVPIVELVAYDEPSVGAVEMVVVARRTRAEVISEDDGVMKEMATWVEVATIPVNVVALGDPLSIVIDARLSVSIPACLYVVPTHEEM
jgi:hypothetical protein